MLKLVSGELAAIPPTPQVLSFTHIFCGRLVKPITRDVLVKPSILASSFDGRFTKPNCKMWVKDSPQVVGTLAACLVEKKIPCRDSVMRKITQKRYSVGRQTSCLPTEYLFSESIVSFR
jgi:hypothetical protein